jgi:hypothetical protein
MPSSTVDLPDPFSPTRNVTPGASSMPSLMSCATAGTVSGHARVERAGSSIVRTAATGG